jgi:hypothetical protein
MFDAPIDSFGRSCPGTSGQPTRLIETVLCDPQEILAQAPMTMVGFPPVSET